MSTNRSEVCASAAKKVLAAAAGLRDRRILLMPDGFVDSIIAVVARRNSPTAFDALTSMAAMAQKIGGAAGRSMNLELVVKLQKLGGNGPIMANAMASAGLGVTYIGMLGYPKMHEVFEPFGKIAECISIAEPGYTDALEFDDGKLMLGKLASTSDVTWENLVQRVGQDRLRKLVDDASLIGMLNWTMLPYLTQLWTRLHERMLKGGRRDRYFFADLCDPAKREPADIKNALNVLAAMQADVKVILGLNLSEAVQVAGVLGLGPYPHAESQIELMARDIRAMLKLECVVIHPRAAAAAATADTSATLAGPFVQKPKLSTGAGDNFNAGFCLGRLLGLSLEESLASGVGTSGYYVRNAQSPTSAQLAQFLAEMPAPESA